MAKLEKSKVVGKGKYKNSSFTVNSIASGFWMGAIGIIKAIFWPAFLVFEAFSKMGV